MKKLIIFLLDLILPLIVSIFCFSVRPWYDGNRTIQAVIDNIQDGKMLFVLLFVALLVLYWRSPFRAKNIIEPKGLKNMLMLWAGSVIVISLLFGIGYLYPKGRWEGVEQTPYLVRLIRCNVVTFVAFVWKIRI